MPTLNRYNYCLQTLSTLALSPRDHQGFYLAASDFSKEDVAAFSSVKKQVKIIYPFYQYGMYPRYQPERTSYYIPGSSIKGALAINRSTTAQPKILVDDIKVDSGNLQLYRLYKAQYLSQDNKEPAIIDEFFPNVAVEMLKAGTECQGELFCEGSPHCEVRPHSYFDKAQQNTKNMLDKLKGKIESSYDRFEDEDSKSVLREMQQNLTGILEGLNAPESNTFTILLGGYKGLMLSGVFDATDFNSAIYIDKQNMLPHGLVQITLE